MQKEFNLYGGDLKVKVDITDEKKDKIIERILQYCKENNCINGETLHQSDNCLLDAPNVLSDIIDNIISFETNWEG
jgi:hypothetical protein